MLKESRLTVCFRYLLIDAFLLFAVSISALAQIDSARVSRDTTIVVSPNAPDTAAGESAAKADTTVAFHMRKSAWLAVGLSAALPGAGQIYNTDYWKAPLIWGLGGYWVSVWLDLNRKYHNYGDLYDESLAKRNPNDSYKTSRDFYRDERDKYAWFMGGLYFLNLVDAYVGANLYDFDVSPDLGPGNKASLRVTGTVRIRF